MPTKAKEEATQSPAIKVIVCTGGACAGKTSLMNILREQGELAGYRLLFVPESATMMFSHGMALSDGNNHFQSHIVRLQVEHENLLRDYASSLGVPVALICDRAIMDNSAYISEEEFTEILNANGLTIDSVMDRYDMVLHLESTSTCAPHIYSNDNNPERYETLEQAACAEQRLREVWSKHPNHHLIGGTDRFDEKISICMNKIKEELEK